MAKRARTAGGKAGKAGRDLAAAGRKAAAMPGAAAVTIGKRLPILARGLARPNAEDGAEITRMVGEKARAAAEVAGIVAKGTGTVLAQTARAAAAAKPTKGMTSANPLTAARAWMDWWSGLTASAWRPWSTGASVANKALTPVHRRVTANAKRLSKRKG